MRRGGEERKGGGRGRSAALLLLTRHGAVATRTRARLCVAHQAIHLTRARARCNAHDYKRAPADGLHATNRRTVVARRDSFCLRPSRVQRTAVQKTMRRCMHHATCNTQRCMHHAACDENERCRRVRCAWARRSASYHTGRSSGAPTRTHARTRACTHPRTNRRQTTHARTHARQRTGRAHALEWAHALRPAEAGGREPLSYRRKT